MTYLDFQDLLIFSHIHVRCLPSSETRIPRLFVFLPVRNQLKVELSERILLNSWLNFVNIVYIIGFLFLLMNKEFREIRQSEWDTRHNLLWCHQEMRRMKRKIGFITNWGILGDCCWDLHTFHYFLHLWIGEFLTDFEKITIWHIQYYLYG